MIQLCSILEYFTSYIMEKLFKTRWWDYSNYKFNINGRICLETMWAFGLLACLVIYFVNRPIIYVLELIPQILFNIIFYILLVIFLIDNIISFKIISNVKSTVKSIKKDSTEEITKYVREVLSNKSLLNKRLMNAFPHLNSHLVNLKNEIRKEIDSKRKNKKN